MQMHEHLGSNWYNWNYNLENTEIDVLMVSA